MHPWPSCHRCSVCDDGAPPHPEEGDEKANLNLMSDCRLMMRVVQMIPKNDPPRWPVLLPKLRTCKTQVCHHATIDM